MSAVVIPAARLDLVLQTPDEVLATVEAMPPADRAEVSPVWLARVRATPPGDVWALSFRAVLRDGGAVVGSCGYKGPPDAEGAVEIAYGIDPEHRRRGYATEAAEALARHALSDARVRVVRAHTRADNDASARALTRCGFDRLGEVIDPEDGLVVRWERRRSPGVLCAGIVVADHVSSPISHLPAAGELVLADQLVLTIGGCAANVAVDLVKLGVTARVCGCVGDDVFGRVVAEMLRERGVDVSGLRVVAGKDTSQTLIVNVKGEDRRFVHTFGANASFAAADLAADAGFGILYLGGYFLMPDVEGEPLAAAFRAARARGMKTVLDVVTPGPGDYTARLAAVLPETDVFMPNDHEAGLITGLSDPVAQAERFRSMGAKTAIVTRGDKGAVLLGEGVRLRAATYSMPFVEDRKSVV